MASKVPLDPDMPRETRRFLDDLQRKADTVDDLVVGETVQAFDAQLYSRIPVNFFSADHTLALSDAAEGYIYNGSGGHTLTIPPTADVAWPNGTIITIAHVGSGNVTLARGSGVTMFWMPTAANADRTLTNGAWGTIWYLGAANTWLLTGVGIS